VDDDHQVDEYGMTLRPLRTYRLTTDKAIDGVSWRGDRVLVSAADQQIDKLGEITTGGQIAPVVGLGRPHAFGPELRPDGTIRYEDDESDAPSYEFVEWNPRTNKRTVLFHTNDDASGLTSGPQGTLFYHGETRDSHGQVTVIRRDKSVHHYPIAADIGAAVAGPQLIAVTSVDIAHNYARTGLTLFDPLTGKQIPVPGWAPVAWSPDGKSLLVERTGAAPAAPSELAVLDPADPAHPRSIGTLPHLTISGGAGQRGTWG
jgi:hypothetical protein